MDTPDLPRPDIFRGEGKKLREEIDTLIGEKNPSGGSLNYVRDARKEQWERWTIFPSTGTKAYESDLEGLSWTNENFQRSVVIQPWESSNFPHWYRDEEGTIYKGSVQYYIDEDGQTIKEGHYHAMRPDILAEYQARGAYHPEAPLPLIPMKRNGSLKYPAILSPLDAGDYERIGAALHQIKSGKWPTFDEYVKKQPSLPRNNS